VGVCILMPPKVGQPLTTTRVQTPTGVTKEVYLSVEGCNVILVMCEPIINRVSRAADFKVTSSVFSIQIRGC